MEYSEIFENFSNREKLVFNFMIQGVKQERIAYILKLNKNKKIKLINLIIYN